MTTPRWSVDRLHDEELVAHVFLDEYLADVVHRTPLTSRGRLERAGR